MDRGGHDRMERADLDFHERVSRAFTDFATAPWQAAHAECGTIVAIDGRGTEREVFARVLAVLAARWPEEFATTD